MLVEIVPTPPFRRDFTVWALRRLPVNEVDRWDGFAYRRVLRIHKSVVEVEITQPAGTVSGDTDLTGRKGVSVTIRQNGDDGAQRVRQGVAEAVCHALGLKADLTPFYRLAAHDERLGELASRFKGLKPPRFFSPFEGLVNGVACQQLSLNVGITLLNRLCHAFGPRLGDSAGFPGPADLASVDPAALRPLGFSRRKAETIVAIAQSVVSGELDLDQLRGLSDREVADRLIAINGIGRWTAQYVALRGLGRWDVFPVDDVGARNNVARWLGLQPPLDDATLGALLAQWRPFAGLVYLHLLLDGLAAQNPTLGF